MAEVVGMAATAITVGQAAVGIGKALIRLRELWCTIRDVPNDILDLFDQIECLDPTLMEAGTLDDLTEVAQQLGGPGRASKSNRKLANLKVVLEKGKLDKVEKRLASSIRMLTLAQQTYLISTAGYQITVNSPKWLSQLSWEIRMQRAMGAWTYTMHSFTRRPCNNEVFRVARHGSSANLRQLFAKGLASPYDRDAKGSTLIHVSQDRSE
ncbi:hypothetical protein F5Y16DRAFT_412627 [Xylariaceae sp. FL0255]|nr:hypothetical protein F5Y16DRAFT_412627 [Xylariaceae sp. FL0255]